jgi:hypothetical protein
LALFGQFGEQPQVALGARLFGRRQVSLLSSMNITRTWHRPDVKN